MSRYREHRRTREEQDGFEDTHHLESLPLSWKLSGLLVALFAVGVLLLWAFQAGYGRLAILLLLVTGGLVLLTWLVNSIRVALAWGKHQVQGFALHFQERQQQGEEHRLALEAQRANIEAVQRRSRAEQLKAQAVYLKTAAEAAQLRMQVEQNQAALRAGLHYPGQHGYPIHLSHTASHQPLIRATDYRALAPRKTEQPDIAAPAGAPALIGQLPLPGPLRDIEVLRGWDLRPDHIYLATGRGGHHLACSLEGWGHIAHDARTGGGKTLLARMELAMMLKLGVAVLVCNPHFAPIGKRGHDWRPIGFTLERQGPVEIAPGVRVGRIQRKTTAIRDLLAYLAQIELDRRYDLQAQGIFAWTPLYVFADEVPWLTTQHPEIIGYLVAILQRGRDVDVRLVTNAQSFLVGNTGLKNGSRDNFGTTHFLGGNPKSGAAMLGMLERDLKEIVSHVQRETHQELGKGLGLLRNLERVPDPEPVRVPFGTNDLQYYLLGRHDDWHLPEFRPRAQPPTQQNTTEHPYWSWDDEPPVPAFQPAPDAQIIEAETEEMLVRRPRSLPAPHVQSPSQMTPNPPGKTPDATSGERPKAYRLSDAEIVPFLAAYKACGNLDKALAAVGRGARYRKHASQLVQANGLRKG